MEGAQKDLVQIPDTPVAGKSVLNGRLGVLGRGSQRAGDGARAKVSGLVHDELFHVRVGTGGVTDTDHHRFTDWQLGLDSQAVINVGTVHLGDDGIGAQLLFRELRLLALADQGHTAPGGAVHNVLVHALPEEKEEPPAPHSTAARRKGMGTAAMAKALGRMEVRPSTKPVNPAGRKARKKRNVSRRRSDSKGSGSPHPGTGLRGEPARL